MHDICEVVVSVECGAPAAHVRLLGAWTSCDAAGLARTLAKILWVARDSGSATVVVLCGEGAFGCAARGGAFVLAEDLACLSRQIVTSLRG